MKIKTFLATAFLLICASNIYSQISIKPLMTFYPEKKENKLYISSLGDMNGDGCEDFAVVESHQLNTFKSIRIYSAKTLQVMKEIEGTFVNISNAKDIDKDGYSDIFMGISRNGKIQLDLILGNKDWDLTAKYSWRGYSSPLVNIQILGDINCDGLEEIAVSETNEFDSGVYAFSRVYIYSLEVLSGVSGKEQTTHPCAIKLRQNYPNPFNSSTTITYELRKPYFVTGGIYDCMGQRVKTILSEEKLAGEYKAIWDGTDEKNQTLSSGIYFFRMSAHPLSGNTENYTETKKNIFLK